MKNTLFVLGPRGVLYPLTAGHNYLYITSKFCKSSNLFLSQPLFYNYQLVFRDNLIVTFKNCIIACLRVLIPALCLKNLVGYFYFFLQVRSFKITARTDGVLHIINSVSL